MGCVKLDNGVLEATVRLLGAELQSLRRLDSGQEYLWQGDVTTWGQRAPVLFPIVGRLREDRYSWRGKTYSLPQHGFARDCLFQLEELATHSATFVLADSEETRQVFPFPFRFAVSYRLLAARLEISLEVRNPAPDELLFSVGGHPGFRCPLLAGECFEDYVLIFERAETAGRWPVLNGLLATTAEPFLLGQRKLCLSRELFARGALVFKDLRSTTVCLESRQSGMGVELGFAGFPYFAVWTKPPGDFVCLEPWYGIADAVDATGRLEEKEGILRLPPHASWRATFFIRPY